MRERCKIWLIGLCGALFLRAVNSTLRWEYVGLSGDDRYWADSKPGILTFWHGRLLFMPWIYLRHRTKGSPRLTALISHHGDGRMVAEVMRRLGIDSVAGSSTRGGLRALHALKAVLQGDSHVAITPDGPKGPRHELKEGVIVIAQHSGALIVPAAISAERKWQFKSWDGMILPKPFSRAVMIKGTPISVGATSDRAELLEISRAVERTLNELTERADNYFRRNA